MQNAKLKFMSFLLVTMFSLGAINYSYNEKILQFPCVDRSYSTSFDKNPQDNVRYGDSEKKIIKNYEKREGILEVLANIYSVRQKFSEKTYVYPGGDLIGIDLYTDGIICVEFEDLKAGGEIISSPAKKAGILHADIITHVNGQKVDSADEFERIISDLAQDICEVTIKRKDVMLKKKVGIVKCDDKAKRIGLWVRDNVMGLGTISFITQDREDFAALGHPISDSSTGITVPVKNGELIGADVLSIVKGRKNHPGEIRGIIRKTDELKATITQNSEFGIYGKIISDKLISDRDLIELAPRSEVHAGDAKIITTIDNERKEYDIIIEEVYTQDEPATKSMMIKITDEDLIEKTGGIIQGMSGSPIIQNGKLVGVVTHVLTGDPKRGYAIYSEWMIKKCIGCQNTTASANGK
ncbi:MAG: SpoIVB peptidase [Eubacteriaceae bacterium]|nr:SpoIVB peptidase [Eubacteriaceae bacterium]